MYCLRRLAQLTLTPESTTRILLPVKRILLINSNSCRVPYPVAPLGLCMLASAIENTFDVAVYDGTFNGGEGLSEAIRTFQPDIVGVSVRNVDDMVPRNGTHFLDGVLREFITPVKAATHAPLILGGSAFSLYPTHLLDAFGADWGVVGEGEKAFPELLSYLAAGKDPSDIPGVAGWKDGRVFVNPPRCETGRLSPPRADVDLHIDFDPYRRLSSYPVQARRGCTHGCIYCTYPAVEGRAYRLRDPADIAAEIAEASARLPGITFEFVDSTFNDPPGHAEAICREIVKAAPGVRLRTMGINPGGVNAELLDGMKAAGFAQIDCTPDSASPRMIKTMGKNFTHTELVRAARLIREHRMPTVWFFLFGGPGEDESTIEETLAFIDQEVDSDDLVLMGMGLRIYPGTPLQRIALREGVIGAGDDLVAQTFYVAPLLGSQGLLERLDKAASTRPNCLPPGENTPSPEMMRQAMELRVRDGLAEPMFRTLLRLRRLWPRFGGTGA